MKGLVSLDTLMSRLQPAIVLINVRLQLGRGCSRKFMVSEKKHYVFHYIQYVRFLRAKDLTYQPYHAMVNPITSTIIIITFPAVIIGRLFFDESSRKYMNKNVRHKERISC